MKHFFLIVALLFSAAAFCQPEFKFDKKVQKFEKVKAGEIVSFDFSFLNSGDQPLLIQEIKVTCNCTKFEYPKTPIKPGEKGNIRVTFDTNNKMGYQDRTLEIISNASKSPETIRFKGMVDHKAK